MYYKYIYDRPFYKTSRQNQEINLVECVKTFSAPTQENISATAPHRSREIVKININSNPKIHIKRMETMPLSDNE